MANATMFPKNGKTGHARMEAEWTAKYVNNLPDSSFLYVAPGGKKDADGKTAPRGLRYFPYKDENGKVDLPHLRNALARIPQAKLPDNVKKRVLAKAKSVAKQNKINVGEEFADAENMRFPLSWPAIVESVLEFNRGVHDEHYTIEEIEYYGRKLAKRFSQTLSLRTDDASYDEDGNIIDSAYDSRSQTTSRYEYHDGLIVTRRGSDSWSNNDEWEYTHRGDDGESQEVVLSGEAHPPGAHQGGNMAMESKGAVIKGLRKSKSMTRDDMAAKMNMTSSRLSEIEGGEEPDEEELKDIAVALGTSLKDLTRRFERNEKAGKAKEDAAVESDEEIEIIDDEGGFEIRLEEYEIAVADDADDELVIAEDDADSVPQANTVYEELLDYQIAREHRTVKSHRLSGEILIEETRDDGTVRFTVPMIQINAVTANGNRYDMECAEGVVADINKLYESKKPVIQRLRDSGKVQENASHREAYENAKQETQRVLTEEQFPSINLEIRGERVLAESFTMMPTHAPRLDAAYGNALTSIAGVIVGGFINYESKTMYIVGETLTNTCGSDVAVLLARNLVKGVSLVGVPVKFEENGLGPKKQGLDVKRLHFLGADFTNNPAMPFKGMDTVETLFELEEN